MEAVFLKLLNMSIAASWLVLAVLILRLLLNKAPRTIHCALWALVAVRLICPFSFESSLSLIPNAETVPQDAVYAVEPTAPDGAPALNAGAAGESVGAAGTTGGGAGAVTGPVAGAQTAPEPPAEKDPVRAALAAAPAIWAAGVALMLLYTLVSYLRIRRKVDEAVELKGNVWLSDHIGTPFILGVIKPRIFLPSDMDAADMEYVLAHEHAHLRRRDHWWKPLGFLLLAAHWFNPAMWAAYALLCRDIELACDEKVIKALGAEKKKPYSDALINCSAPRRMAAACPLAFGETGVEKRVKFVLRYKKPAFWIIAAGVAACAVVAVCFLTDPPGSSGEPDLSFLNYKNAIPLVAEMETLTAIYCPSDQAGPDHLLQIGVAAGSELAKYLDQWDWRECGAPSSTLPSPGSVEFVIQEDYRITVHQRKSGMLRRYAVVKFRDEARYYSIDRNDYPDAVALCAARPPDGTLTAVAPETLREMQFYLERRYTATADNDAISENAGYLFAVNAIRRVTDGAGSDGADGSGMTYAALQEAYASKALSDYYIFGQAHKSAGEQYAICAENGLLAAHDGIDEAALSMQTGDLMFWKDAAGSIAHVGMYFAYDGKGYVIEYGSDGAARVTDMRREDGGLEFAGYARVNTAVVATYKPYAAATQILHKQKVLFNCPPVPPTPPERNGYSFVEWQPSVTEGMKGDTAYAAAYRRLTESELASPTPAPIPTPAAGWIDTVNPDELVLERTEEEPGVACETVEMGTLRAFTGDSVTYEKGYWADIPDEHMAVISTGEFVTLTVDENSEFWTMGFLEYFEYGKVGPDVFAKWFETNDYMVMDFYSEDGKLLMAVQRYTP